MAIEFAPPDCEPEDCLKGMSGWPSPGFHHAQVIEAEEEAASIKIKFEIVAGPDAGRNFTEWFYTHSEKGEDAQAKINQRLVGTALRLRLISTEYYQQCKQTQTPMSIDFTQAIGCQCVIELFMDPKGQDKQGNQKDKLKLRFDGVHTLDDKKVLDAKPPVEINREIAAMWGYTPPDPFANPPSEGPAASPTKTPPKQPGPKPTTVAAPATKPNGGAAPSIYDQI